MPIVEIDNITKKFGDVQVLNGISLSVERGQVIAIIGRSGSGKSTMLRCINGLEMINSGSIKVAGHTLTANGSGLIELRKDVGMVFQSYNLFPHLTVEENVMLSPRIVKKVPTEKARETAIKVLTQVGLDHRRDAYPEQLSGGQQQRVAIARSLAMEPQVMLFDEVTSALDPELTQEVLVVMEELARAGMTMLLVTHEMEFARNMADITVFMHEGKIWEAAPSEAFFASPQTPEARQFIGAGKSSRAG
ncbi:amino acid ABC transporter ATP-binding protein [Pollutimonas thiosulfatoxidans]|uniref:Amino acid ABC transporter ATP-binding protein n=1 Tax=Pollutimonas thiosulfatoxidans TaxID=2028345 RepID=A0A410G9U3_9BURK|nr:amino acid ABC transporter ATP-binding protein [Pollutimonas thiosulfatoxidans]MBF6616077.1 amino acid ABC transporter ATP-binding protein [Candidimonas sp.]NYT45054.1 amino acid ABC transporter ATP-binding protein [Alcaligenaceae bacterium]QAA93037.1 amino acid ABC transporter ATP-binding protein [Pollutimonas thiosulfatoxidans]